MPENTKTPPTASHVSRALKAAGEHPLPSGTSRMREGVRVTGGIVGVRVSVDLDNATAAERRAADCAEILTAAGYAVELDGAYLTVTGS